MKDAAARVGWAVLVVAAGAAVARGLLLTTHIELTPQAQADADRGRLLLWVATLELPIIALSQLNRGPEQRGDERPMTSEVRESGSLEQGTDMVSCSIPGSSTLPRADPGCRR